MRGVVRTGFVAIGRNEGERLKRCLRSMPDGSPIVYVDSGSSDDSVAFARSLHIVVEVLSSDIGFTAARARNVGWRRLIADHPDLEFVQFIDGDCELALEWVGQGERALDAEVELCAVFGRLRERYPEASFYNALCDDEWDVPVGLAAACGGIALFRAGPLVEAGGFNDDIIAGEEPDLCLRLGQCGWKVRRIDAEMALHDAAITRASQWWMRMRRGGHAFAEHVTRHGSRSLPSWRRNRDSVLLWALAIPAMLLTVSLCALIFRQSYLAVLACGLLLIYPMQVVRLAIRQRARGKPWGFSIGWAAWLVGGKFAQLLGIVQFHWKRGRGQKSKVIEYKN